MRLVERKNSKMNLQKINFKIYIFILPFLLLPGLNEIKNMFSPSASIENDFFLLVIGIILLMMINHGNIYYEYESLYVRGMKVCFQLVVISLITSFVFFIPFGTLYGENTITASIPNDIYMIITATTFYYNAQMFQLVSRKEIEKILDILCVVMIIVGYIQILCLYSSIIGGIYDKVDILGILIDSQQIQRWGRICLVGAEPSAVGDILNILLCPYMLGQVLYTSEKKYKWYWILTMPIMYFTYSSTVYIGLVANIIAFIIIYLRDSRDIRKILHILLILTLFCVILLLGGNYILNNTEIGGQIKYFLFEKTTMNGNLSTEVRYSSVFTDIYVFFHYPISGVGNGNQGYFYNEVVRRFIKQSALSYSELADRLSGAMGIVNGGAFVPAFISGYGVLGLYLAIRFVKKCVDSIKNMPEIYGGFGYMYYIGGLTFLVLTTVSGGLDGNFLAIFVISIPFMDKCIREIGE